MQVHWRLPNKSMLWIFVHGSAVFLSQSVSGRWRPWWQWQAEEKCTNKLRNILQYQTKEKNSVRIFASILCKLELQIHTLFLPPLSEWTLLWMERKEKNSQLEVKKGTCKKWSAFAEKKRMQNTSWHTLHAQYTCTVLCCTNTVCSSPRLWINKC